MSTPSPNGKIGRTSTGRFASGNPGGPGNPHGRRVAQLRAAMMSAISDDDMTAIIQAVVEQARQGDLQAVKILLDYTCGRPTPAADPDALEKELRRAERMEAEANCGFRTVL